MQQPHKIHKNQIKTKKKRKKNVVKRHEGRQTNVTHKAVEMLGECNRQESKGYLWGQLEIQIQMQTDR